MEQMAAHCSFDKYTCSGMHGLASIAVMVVIMAMTMVIVMVTLMTIHLWAVS